MLNQGSQALNLVKMIVFHLFYSYIAGSPKGLKDCTDTSLFSFKGMGIYYLAFVRLFEFNKSKERIMKS